MKKINILVTAVGGIVAQGIIKSLIYYNKFSKNRDIQYHITGTDISYEACGLYRSDEFCIINKPESKNYIEQLIDICKKKRIEVILIGSDVELPIVGDNIKNIEDQTRAKVVSSNKEIIETFRDKYKTFEFLKKNNLNYIPTTEAEHLQEFISKYDFPVVIKPKEGFGSKFFFIAKEEKDIEYAISSIKNIGWQPIIQKYLKNDNEEYTIGITISKDGKNILSSIVIKKMLKHGQTYKAIIDRFPKLRKISEDIAKKTGAIGPINIQIRIDPDDDKPKVLEINPRFSATCPMRTSAGINEPHITIKNFLFNEKLNLNQYKSLICMRYWNETYIDLKEFNQMKSNKSMFNKLKSSIIDYF